MAQGCSLQHRTRVSVFNRTLHAMHVAKHCRSWHATSAANTTVLSHPGASKQHRAHLCIHCNPAAISYVHATGSMCGLVPTHLCFGHIRPWHQLVQSAPLQPRLRATRQHRITGNTHVVVRRPACTSLPQLPMTLHSYRQPLRPCQNQVIQGSCRRWCRASVCRVLKGSHATLSMQQGQT